MPTEKSQSRINRILKTGYVKTAGRLVVFIWLTSIQFMTIFAVSEVDASAANDLFREMAVNLGSVSTSLILMPFYLAIVWVFAPMIVQIWDDYRGFAND